MANDLAKKIVFDWLMSPCFEPSALGGSGGGIELIVNEDGIKTVIRPFPIEKIEADQVSSVASLITDRIVGEAEAYCEGRGGGRKSFTLKATKDGERKPVAIRPFAVEVERNDEGGGEVSANDANAVLNQALRVISEMRQEKADIHKVLLDMAKGYSMSLPKIMESQAAMLALHQKMQGDNFLMLRANIENQVGREAEAYKAVQQAKDWSEMKTMLMQMGAPMLMQFMAKQLGSGDDENK